MKHLWVNLFHKTILVLSIFILLLAVVLSAIRLSLPWFEYHQGWLMGIAETALAEPIQIDHIKTSWHKLSPVLQLQNVRVFEGKRIILFLPETDLEFDVIHSLLTQKFVIAKIIIKGAHLALKEDNNKHWQLIGAEQFSDQSASSDAEAFFSWLLSINRIRLDQANITIIPFNWQKFSLQRFNLDIKNHYSQHSIAGTATIKGTSESNLSLTAELDGQANSLQKIHGNFYFKFSRTDLAAWLTKINWHNFYWQKGLLSGEIWLQSDHGQLSSWQAKLTGDDVSINQITETTPWQLNAKILQFDIAKQANHDAQLLFNGQTGSLLTGGLFRKAIPFVSFAGNLSSQNKDQQTIVDIPSFILKTSDGIINTKIQLSVPDNTNISPQLLLAASANFNKPNVSLYLPAHIMPEKVVDWLDHAILSTKTVTGKIIFRGPIHNFPFMDNSGVMIIDGQVTGARLHYHPQWPELENLSANLHFTSKSMHITADEASTKGIIIKNVTADIPNFKGGATLIINLNSPINLSSAMDFLQASPLDKYFNNLNKSLSLDGPAALQLNVTLPLSSTSTEKAKTSGILKFNNALIHFVDSSLNIDQLQGTIPFTNDTISSSKLTGSFTQQPIQISLQRLNDQQGTLLQAQGNIDSSKLMKNSRWLQGIFPFIFNAAISSNTKKITFASSLHGLALNLPAEFSKTADTDSPLTVESLSDNSWQANWQNKQQNISLLYSKNPNSSVSSYRINTPNIAGLITSPARDGLPWQVNFFRFNLSDNLKNSSTSQIKLVDVPALDFHADNPQLGAIKFNSIAFKLRPNQQSVQIQQLQLTHPDFQVAASGIWSNAGTSLNGQLTTTQLGKTLVDLDLSNFMDAANTKLSFNLSWPLTPWQINMLGARGSIKISAQNGTFKKISKAGETGLDFGRLLGLLSLENLPNRLSTHFNDVTQKGFQFDTFKGTLQLTARGIKTQNLLIKGPIADANINGCIKLTDNQYQLAVAITPHLTSSFPVIAAIAGGPVIGAVTYLANKLFVGPTVGQLTTFYYYVHGPMSALKTDKRSSDVMQMQFDCG